MKKLVLILASLVLVIGMASAAYAGSSVSITNSKNGTVYHTRGTVTWTGAASSKGRVRIYVQHKKSGKWINKSKIYDMEDIGTGKGSISMIGKRTFNSSLGASKVRVRYYVQDGRGSNKNYYKGF